MKCTRKREKDCCFGQNQQSGKESTKSEAQLHCTPCCDKIHSEEERKRNAMKIHGLQKMTLLDYPGRVACTVFLGGCDFRCPFCHNAEILDAGAPAETDDGELLKFLEKRTGLLDGVVITGGEPLLRPDIDELIEKIHALGYPVKLDTNGNHPAMLKKLVGAGLIDYVAMDVKNGPSRYAETVGLADFDMSAVRESIDFLLGGAVDYEFRTTVVKELHDEQSFAEIGKLIRGAKRYYLQCFTDRDTVLFAGLHAPEKETLERYAEIVGPYVKSVELRGI